MKTNSNAKGPCITVYRGTRLCRELQLFQETDGYVMSEAAIDGYATRTFNGVSFDSAWHAGLNDSNVALATAFYTWGSVGLYSLAHSEFGTELTKAFGPRPAISWTTDLATAQRFAGNDGYVLKAQIPVANILNVAKNNGEFEVLVANGTRATVHVWPTRR